MPRWGRRPFAEEKERIEESLNQSRPEPLRASRPAEIELRMNVVDMEMAAAPATVIEMEVST